MNLIDSKNTVSGSYMYDKYKSKILLNGVSDSNSIELQEKTINGTATITLVLANKRFAGKWCDKKCVPITIQTNNSFRNGELKGVEIDDSDASNYKIKVKFKNKNEVVIISDAVDIPSVEFVDINNDGFYDLIATTDHRPNNGSQEVYLSGDNGFIKDDILSKENGTLVYDPYSKNVIFNSKDDCCNVFRKVVYSFHNSQAVKDDIISFDYSLNKGKDSKGHEVLKDKFESY